VLRSWPRPHWPRTKPPTILASDRGDTPRRPDWCWAPWHRTTRSGDRYVIPNESRLECPGIRYPIDATAMCDQSGILGNYWIPRRQKFCCSALDRYRNSISELVQSLRGEHARHVGPSRIAIHLAIRPRQSLPSGDRMVEDCIK